MWRQHVNEARWYLIPPAVGTARTFARDNVEVVYVERMARAVRERARVATFQDTPMFALRDGVLGRWRNAFDIRPEITVEMEMRVKHGLFVPHDSPESLLLPLDVLRAILPSTLWFSDLFFPTAVPVPTPPVIFFFHDMMMNGNAATRAYLENVFQIEFAFMFACFWWQEAVRGGVGVVLPAETINYLTRVLGDVPIDPDRAFGPGGQTTFAHVLRQM